MKDVIAQLPTVLIARGASKGNTKPGKVSPLAHLAEWDIGQTSTQQPLRLHASLVPKENTQTSTLQMIRIIVYGEPLCIIGGQLCGKVSMSTTESMLEFAIMTTMSIYAYPQRHEEYCFTIHLMVMLNTTIDDSYCL